MLEAFLLPNGVGLYSQILWPALTVVFTFIVRLLSCSGD